MELSVIILAAGKGTRMKSDLPKVLHPIAHKPLLGHVLDTTVGLNAKQTCVVIGHGANTVKETFAARTVTWVEQKEQKGTGHAVQQALPHIKPTETVLILYGDVPLCASSTLTSLISCVSEQSIGLLTVTLENPTGYGRIIRDHENQVTGIVEEKDATPGQKQITEV
ncbi:MAG: NTP transferase domain-containing protein, partial [Gammaproteobacteria bacterium]|nr:NTP transferase domain-containing protein [Gammaproteobacteria bacterium]